MTRLTTYIFCLIALFTVSQFPGLLPAGAFAGVYRIGSGDVLNISVWKDADLTRQVVVLPDGNINFPLAGEVAVEGLTVSELETLLVSKLKKYVSDPILTVSVHQTNSMMIYVIGQVRSPGRFLVQDDINALQALSLAGGLTSFAKEKEIKVFRKTGEDTRIFNFNYKDVANGEFLEQNITLERGDVIVVR